MYQKPSHTLRKFLVMEELFYTSVPEKIDGKISKKETNNFDIKEKLKNLLYKYVFLGLSSLFVVLGFLVFFKTPNFMSGLYFNNHAFVLKDGITMICLFFGIGSFVSGHSIRSEKKDRQTIAD